jgi:hypothetical protein
MIRKIKNERDSARGSRGKRAIYPLPSKLVALVVTSTSLLLHDAGWTHFVVYLFILSERSEVQVVKCGLIL